MEEKKAKILTIQEEVKKLKEFSKKVTSSKSASENYLKKTGIYTNSGNLKSIYKK
ncbi:MAG: hypothetical protein MH321_08685 [Leptospiraceae bacterium]|jgi:hypothetical protein|nr:hypothetical protein [Leptospiraceae bacterium]